MKADNPLTREFILKYPAEAARVLEQVSAGDAAALFSELSAEILAPVIVIMLPEMSAACISAMPMEAAVEVLKELPVPSVARILRLLSGEKREELSAMLPEKSQKRMRRYMEYPPDSAGALLDTKMEVLPESATVAESIRRIGRLDRPASCEIYVVDDAHHLVGRIHLGRLLKAGHQARLSDIMNRKCLPVYIHATTEALLQHPGWAKRRRLPVVERDNTLAGILDYNRLKESIGENAGRVERDPLQNLMSLAGLYWLTVAQVLDSMLSIARAPKGERK
jgi:magnesium transporter